jgi:uncharacterized repeat protein (TIGR01451 family)
MKAKFTLLIILCLGAFSKAYAQPTADFSWSNDSCGRASFTDLSTCNGCTIVSWDWDFGDGTLNTQQNPVHWFGGVGTYPVSLTVFDNSGFSDTQFLDVTIGCLDVSITADAPTDCFFNGDCVNLQVTASGGTPPYSYQWTTGLTIPQLEVCNIGSYTVWVTDANGTMGTDNFLLYGSFFPYIIPTFEDCGDGSGSLTITQVAGTSSPLTYLWNNGGTTSSISNLSAGNYYVTITDTSGCSGTFPAMVYDSCGYIYGNVFFDANGNTVQDLNEPPFTNGHIISTGNTVFELQTNYSGEFNIWVEQGNFTTNFVPDLNYFTVSPVDHLSQINNSNDEVDFAVAPIPGNPDLQIFLTPSGSARPGFEAQYRLTARNVGSETLSGSIRFAIDPLLSFVSANPVYDSFMNDSMTWNFTDFAPTETMNYFVWLSVPAPLTVNIGDILSFSAVIYPVQGDMVPSDNYDDLFQTATNSFDPNDKWVNHDTLSPTQVTQAEYLNYRIRFQNTGTDTAFTVAVRDTLDQNLDWSSLQMINASHNYTLSTRGGNALEWRFENILLPDSNTNEPQSHGYIFYRIKPKTNLALNDSIANTAAIYFDFNPPVITNTAYSEVALPVSISENTLDAALDIFPNPNNGEFTVQFSSARSGSYNFELTDISGRVIYSQHFNHKTQTHLRPSLKLASGIYLLIIADDQSKTTRKLVIR